MEEVWRLIEGTEYYLISNLGRVKSLSRKYCNGRKVLSERIMKQTDNHAGYKVVNLAGLKNRLVHRLIAVAFIPNPLNRNEINHKNGNKQDNRIENLEWCTRQENQKHAWDTGLISCMPASFGANNNKAKLNDGQVLEIRKKFSGRNIAELSNAYSLTPASVRNIINRKTWKHIN